MRDLFITEVVKKLIILNIAVFFIAYYAFPSLADMLILHYPFAKPVVAKATQMLYNEINNDSRGEFMPMQIVTSMFMHGNANHLIMNMLSLFFLGPFVELELGKERFFLYYIGTGLGATALHLLFQWYDVNYSPAHDEFIKLLISNSSVTGASGALFGIIAALGLLLPHVRLSAYFIPFQIPAWVVALIYLCVELYHIFFHPTPGIAHYAHIGGALCGGIILFFWKRRRID
jgi:membrane associated rhomboid family serine protease